MSRATQEYAAISLLAAKTMLPQTYVLAPINATVLDFVKKRLARRALPAPNA
jgi:hypothetical protein